jgi:hypothetical protein
MFHELWIGMDIHASFKSRFFGFCQKNSSKSIEEIRGFRDQYADKSIPAKDCKWLLRLLPLFSVIFQILI